MNKDHHQVHVSVLLAEVLRYLAPEKGQNLLDVTAGYGGHAAAILDITKQYDHSVLVDRDAMAIRSLKKRFSDRINIIHSDFAAASKQLSQEGKQFDMILADLGVSSVHFDNVDRGFSFRSDAFLDMRMDNSRGITASDLLNTSSEERIEQILKAYGQEPRAKYIAKQIKANCPIVTTSQLANIVSAVYSDRLFHKIHPATRTFQAIRIVVNDELIQLKESLPIWLKLLRHKGRLAIISFHSLEDRIVKQYIKSNAGNHYDSKLDLLVKKPIISTETEVVNNPRARSAKLRVAVKK